MAGSSGRDAGSAACFGTVCSTRWSSPGYRMLLVVAELASALMVTIRCVSSSISGGSDGRPVSGGGEPAAGRHPAARDIRPSDRQRTDHRGWATTRRRLPLPQGPRRGLPRASARPDIHPGPHPRGYRRTRPAPGPAHRDRRATAAGTAHGIDRAPCRDRVVPGTSPGPRAAHGPGEGNLTAVAIACLQIPTVHRHSTRRVTPATARPRPSARNRLEERST